MIGKKTMTATSMISSVSRLDVESQTVRLLFASEEDGMMNGNIEKPAVRMMPAIMTPVAMKAVFSKRERATTNAARPPAKPIAGAIAIHGKRS